MKLEEMQKIWDSKSNQTLFVMNQESVEKHVKNRSNKVNKRAAFVENFIIGMNFIVPTILFLLAYLNDKLDFGEYAVGAFMFATVIFTFNYKMKRINSQKNWGITMLDSIDQAIHNATYQAKMTKVFLTWYILGVGALSVINLIIEDANPWLIVMISFVFLIGFIVGKWEQRSWHDKQRDDLIALREKLISE